MADGMERLGVSYSALSANFSTLRSQPEQSLSGGLNFALGQPGVEHRSKFRAQQFQTPRPTLVRVAGTST
jgi:hypothetical protein